MARYAIDAPTLLHLVTQAVTVHPEHQLVAPNTVRTHALDLLYAAVGRGEIAERDALALHERMTEIRMRLLGDRVSRTTAWRIARERGWESLHDAEYAAVTRLQADALVTVDRARRRRLAGVVPMAKVAALGTPGHDPSEVVTR